MPAAAITTNDSVTMICPNLNCSRTITTPTANRGKTARCPYCNALFRVPKDPGPADAPRDGGPDRNAAAERK
jgi:hypothetical protein